MKLPPLINLNFSKRKLPTLSKTKMTITDDYSVFLEGCVKNNAVDYKILYNNKCKECKELEIKADAETTANMIDKLNEEYNELQSKCDKLETHGPDWMRDQNKYLKSEKSKLIKMLCGDKLSGDFEQFIRWLNMMCGDEDDIDMLDILEELNIEVIFHTRDYFEQYWEDLEIRTEFREWNERVNDITEEDFDDWDDFDENADVFEEWYIEEHLCPTLYCYDYDYSLYYIE